MHPEQSVDAPLTQARDAEIRFIRRKRAPGLRRADMRIPIGVA
jgi:hypothetical protein